MTKRRRRALQVVVMLLALGAVYPALRITGLWRPRAAWTPNPRAREFACPFPEYRRGDGPTDPEVPWTSVDAVERDRSLKALCFRDDDCTVVSFAAGCCESQRFPVLKARAGELADVVSRCRGRGAECMQKCMAPGEVAACWLGVCTLRPRPAPSPEVMLRGMPGY